MEATDEEDPPISSFSCSLVSPGACPLAALLPILVTRFVQPFDTHSIFLADFFKKETGMEPRHNTKIICCLKIKIESINKAKVLLLDKDLCDFVFAISVRKMIAH